MSPFILRRLATRSSSIFSHSPVLGGSTATASSYGASQLRKYAVEPSQSTNTGPKSSSSEGASNSASRSKDSEGSPDTASTQTPVSQGGENVSGAHAGEESTSTNEQVHSRPDMSPAEKKRQTEKAGDKPMGPEDEASSHHVGA